MSDSERIAALEAENAELVRINQVLMDRVERSTDLQGDSFSIFQTAVILEEQVRQRTLALERTKRNLHEAIVSIDEGFVLWGADDRLVVSNDRFRAMWGVPNGFDGTFPEALNFALSTQRVRVPDELRESWLAARLEAHRSPGRPMIVSDGHGNWIQVSERRTRDGGTVGLYTDITGVKTAETVRRQAELHRAVEHLTEVNTELERFAYVASHDLREPLRTIVSFTQLLSRHLEDRPELSEYLDLIINAGLRMNSLIGGLLEYSRLGSMSSPFETCDLAQSMAAVGENLRDSLQQAGADLTVLALPTVNANRVLMVQLLQNLVGNAIKYRSQDKVPVIRVSALDDGDHWLIAVADNGIGIEDSAQDIYELFRRLHGPSAYPGAGIGLAVCRRIVQHHGGRLWHENNPGGGTVFSFTLSKHQSALERSGGNSPV